MVAEQKKVTEATTGVVFTPVTIPPTEHFMPPVRTRSRAPVQAEEAPSRPQRSPLPARTSSPKLRESRDRRRREFTQSVFAGLFGTLLLVCLLWMIHGSPELRTTPPLAVTLAPVDPPPEIPPEKLSRRSSSPSAAAAPPPPTQMIAVPTPPAAVTAISSSPISLSAQPLPTTALASLPSQAFGFGSSIDAENRGRGGNGLGNGLKYGDWGRAFDGLDLGNGEGTLLLLDVSGSMQQISEEVMKLTKRRFPETRKVHSNGCGLKLDGPLYTSLNRGSALHGVETLFIVCDLFDGVSGAGVNQMRKLLADSPISVHVISFGKPAHTLLAKFIVETGGSFTQIEVERPPRPT